MIDRACRSPRAIWGWLLLLVGATAASIDLGALHAFQTADSLLLVLISLQHWTPFFWGQDRFGMLVPLIATPFRDPLVNLLVQNWLTIVAALLAPFLIARYLIRGSQWVAVGAVANSLLFVLSFKYQFDWLVMQPYALSVSLAFAALLLAESTSRIRTAAAVSLMLLAHWVNLTICMVVLPCTPIGRRFFTRRLSIAAAGALGGFCFKQWSHQTATTTSIVPAGEWPHGWMMLLRTTASVLDHPRWLMVVAALATFSAITLWKRGSLWSTARMPAAALGIAVAYWIATGTFKHVQMNDYLPRYVLPALVMTGVALAAIIVAPLKVRSDTTSIFAVTLLVAAALASYGPPSAKSVRKTLDRNFGASTATVIDVGATVIAGDYWRVWPAVFHANMTVYRLTGHTPIFGLTYRSEPTDPLWLRCRGRDVVLLAQGADRSVEGLIASHHVPATLTAYTGGFAMFVVPGGDSQDSACF